MAWQRAKAKAVPPVDAVAGKPLLPGPVVGPVGRVDVLPADIEKEAVPVESGLVVVAGRPLKVNAAMARFMAKPKSVEQVAEPEPESGSEPDGLPYMMPPQGFDRWEPNVCAKWVDRNWRDIPDDELKQEAVSERLAECRVRAGRGKL